MKVSNKYRKNYILTLLECQLMMRFFFTDPTTHIVILAHKMFFFVPSSACTKKTYSTVYRYHIYIPNANCLPKHDPELARLEGHPEMSEN